MAGGAPFRACVPAWRQFVLAVLVAARTRLCCIAFAIFDKESGDPWAVLCRRGNAGMSLTQLRTRKCRACGHVQLPKEGDECTSCGEHDKWRFFCEKHGLMFDSPVCSTCEQAARQREEEARAHREEQERRRREAEELERRRLEYELEQQRRHEEELRRAAEFSRIIRVPACVALVASVLCFGLAAQLFACGAFVMPYTMPLLFLCLGTGLVAALSIFVIALFFN